MNRKRNWIVAAILTAAAGVFALQNRISQESPISAAPPSETTTREVTLEDTPTFTPTYEGCAYMWASHDSPALTESLNASVLALNPLASANVGFFGEDCVYADGHSIFGAKETDFYVRLRVEDLTHQEELGNWMAQVLPLVLELPDQEIQGSFGFVEFWFIRGEFENVIVRIPIQQYQNEAQGKRGEELFRMYHEPPVTPAPT